MSAPRRALALTGLLCAAAFALSTTDRPAAAADHFDAPSRTDPLVNPSPDTPADIADVYVWHTASDLVIALTFAGPQPAGRPPTYDRDILYTINISNANSPTDPEVQLRFRFGRDSSGNVGVEVSGLPDGGPPLVGPVEQTLTRNGILVRAGSRRPVLRSAGFARPLTGTVVREHPQLLHRPERHLHRLPDPAQPHRDRPATEHLGHDRPFRGLKN